MKLAIDLSVPEKSKVIGSITSAIPDEGKSTISANLALLMAQVGARVLLVDGDLRNPSLSRALAPVAKGGILEVASGRSSLKEVVWTDPATNLAFLPAAMPFRPAHSNEIFLNDLTKQLFVKSCVKAMAIISSLTCRRLFGQWRPCNGGSCGCLRTRGGVGPDKDQTGRARVNGG